MDKERIPKWAACVKCYTYNQAPYIVDTMNGFTIQKTNFPFVCVFVDDASTDGETEVIREYVAANFIIDNERYNDSDTDDYEMFFAQHKTNVNCYFAVLFLKYNHYQIKKPKLPYVSRWDEEAKYLALCEGDDYWIDPNKLNRQVDFLDKHPSYSLCYGRAKIFIQSENCFKGVKGNDVINFDSLLKNGNTIPTLTALYRRDIFDQYTKEVKPNGWLMGDYPLWLYMASKGEIFFEPREVGVYRVLNNSSSHFTSYEKHIKFENSIFDIQKYFSEMFGVNEIDNDYIVQEHFKRSFRIAYKHRNVEEAKKWYKLVKKRGIKMLIKRIYLCLNLV